MSATLTQWTKGTYNVANAASGTGSSTNYTVTVVIADYNEGEIDGTLVKREDKQVFMGGAEQAPDLNDKLTINGVVYDLINIKPIKPASVVVAYQMQVRK